MPTKIISGLFRSIARTSPLSSFEYCNTCSADQEQVNSSRKFLALPAATSQVHKKNTQISLADNLRLVLMKPSKWLVCYRVVRAGFARIFVRELISSPSLHKEL